MIRKNRVNQINQPTNETFRSPLSPQHQFQPLNLYRNHHLNPRAMPDEPTTIRNRLSPTLHNFQSPPPTMMAQRKMTTVNSPQHSNNIPKWGPNSPNSTPQGRSPPNQQFFRPPNYRQFPQANSPSMPRFLQL